MTDKTVQAGVLALVWLCVACGNAAKEDKNTGTVQVDDLTGDEVDPEVPWVRIEAGSFLFGSPDDELPPCYTPAEKQVPVTLTRPYFMAATEVTQAQWEALGLRNASWHKGPNKPVTIVSFYEAAAWCNKLSRLEGLEPCYDLTNCTGTPGGDCVDTEGTTYRSCGTAPQEDEFRCQESVRRYPDDLYACPGYRLPTSAEWEYAARGGVYDTHTYGGDLIYEAVSECNDQPALNDIAWYCGNTCGHYACGIEQEPPWVQDVAQKLPNPYGLYDTLGNVFEWIDYFFSGRPLDKDSPGEHLVDPQGPDFGTERELRSYPFNWTGCDHRPAASFNMQSHSRSYQDGFRPVRTIFE